MFRILNLSTFFAWSFAALVCSVGIILTSFYLYLTPKLPNPEQLKTTQLQTPLRIYSSDLKKIAEFGEKRRTPIQFENAPSAMINAFIAAEDNRFFSHHGIDIKGLIRAAAQLISTGRIVSGGSTITMQVAKNFFLSRERTFVRKFNEIFLAIQIEQALSKTEIFELYLNKIYLGNRAYGIHAAAQVYYGKLISELTLAESAMIAGLPKAPSRYNPIANPVRATIRRNWILDRMLELDMISIQNHKLAIDMPNTARYHGGRSEISAPYVAEMARLKILEIYGSAAYTEGLKAYLTVDSTLQEAANRATKTGLEDYDRRHGYRGPNKQLSPEQMLAPDTITQALRETKTAHSNTAALVLSIEESIATLQTLTHGTVELDLEHAKWAKPYITVDRTGKEPTSLEDILKSGDIIEVRQTPESLVSLENPGTWQLTQAPDVQGALISISPLDGGIKALVGGYDFNLSHYNRATQAKRQPGSNFKPFVYLAALEQGNTAATLINDAPIVFDDKNLEAVWRPENSSGKFYGPTRLRKALYNSRNLVSIRLLKNTGIRNTISTIKKFGFNKAELPRDLSLALGSAAITPIKIATGYSILANGGNYIEPYLVERIENAKGETIYQANPLTVCETCRTSEEHIQTTAESNSPAQTNIAPRIADKRAVYIIHSMLKDVIKKGTGRRALTLKRTDLAGKTGTTNDQKDAWFSGFNSELETSVWVGFDRPKTLGRREYGAKAALPIWKKYMSVALHDTDSAHMKQPNGIVTVRIDPETGLLASPGASKAMFEIFRSELSPNKAANKAQANPRSPEDQTISPEDIF